ncbi:hypothetical protein ACRTDU_05265 [Sunxiuqinia elliptica]
MKTTILMTLFFSLSIVFAGFQNKTKYNYESVGNATTLSSTDINLPWILTAYADADLSPQRINELDNDITERLIIEFDPNENQITTTGFLKKQKIPYELTDDYNINCKQFSIKFDSSKTQMILSDDSGNYAYKQLKNALDLVQPNGFPLRNNNLFIRNIITGNYHIIRNQAATSDMIDIKKNTIKGIKEWEGKELNIWLKVGIFKENIFTIDNKNNKQEPSLKYQWSLKEDTLVLKNVARNKTTSEYQIGDIEYELLKSN